MKSFEHVNLALFFIFVLKNIFYFKILSVSLSLSFPLWLYMIPPFRHRVILSRWPLLRCFFFQLNFLNLSKKKKWHAGETLQDERINGGAFVGTDGLQFPQKLIPVNILLFNSNIIKYFLLKLVVTCGLVNFWFCFMPSLHTNAET